MEERLKGLEDDNGHLHSLLAQLAAENVALKEQLASLSRGASAAGAAAPALPACAAAAAAPMAAIQWASLPAGLQTHHARGHNSEPAALTYLATLLILCLCVESEGVCSAASLLLFTTLFFASSGAAAGGRRGTAAALRALRARGLPALKRSSQRTLLAGAKLATRAHGLFMRLFGFMPRVQHAYLTMVVGAMQCMAVNNLQRHSLSFPSQPGSIPPPGGSSADTSPDVVMPDSGTTAGRLVACLASAAHLAVH